MSAAWPLQKAIYAHLGNSPSMTALLGNPLRLFDVAPERAAFPFVNFSDWRTTPLAGVENGEVHDIRFHVHSRYQGRRETRDIQTALYDNLQDAVLVPEGASLVSLRFVFADLFLSADGQTWNGVSRFRAATQILTPDP